MNLTKRLFNRLKKIFDLEWMKLALKNDFMCRAYYFFFSKEFQREQRAMISGKLLFQKSKIHNVTTSSLLRRNIHRIEKGILSRPRREVFALNYIDETFNFYERQLQTPQDLRISSHEELKWAHDVLQEYFKITSAHPKLDPFRERFRLLAAPNGKAQVNEVEPELKPYKRSLARPLEIEYDELLNLAWRRRSVRWFLPDPVPREKIEKAITVAGLSPSACNRQPFVFRVFDDPELVKKVAVLPGGTKGYAHQFPVIIALIGELRNYYGERDKHLIYIDASLAAMSFVFAAETLGLGTCCINWPDIEEDEKRAAAVLKLDLDQRPVMFIAVGYADPEGMVAYSQKKPVNQLCKYNFE